MDYYSKHFAINTQLNSCETNSSIKHNKLAMAMASSTAVSVLMLLSLLPFLFLVPSSSADRSYGTDTLPQSDIDLLEFPLNLEYLEAEFFLFGAFGYGLDKVAPELTGKGPCPVGGKKANLCPLINDITAQFAFQEVGHLRAIKSTVKGFPRPLLNLTEETFAAIMNKAFGKTLSPPFNPYANDLNYLIASYVIPYVGLTGYVGANPKLQSPTAKRLVAGLLAVESGQDAVLRALLYERVNETVKPYGITVGEFTDRISALRNDLGHAGVKDEGLTVKTGEGADGRIKGNILAGDKNSVAFDRTPEEILRIVYGTGSESKPGGFYPHGADGRIAKSFLKHSKMHHP